MIKLDNERGSICISTEVITWLSGDAATRSGSTKCSPRASPRRYIWSTGGKMNCCAPY